MAMKLGQRNTLKSLGYRGVRDTTNPYVLPANVLRFARNIYLPDPVPGCSAYARPGFELENATAPIGADGTTRYGQSIKTATIEDGTVINFIVVSGRLLRVDATFGGYEDVTPAGVAIDAASRVYLTPFSNRLIVQDDVNTPWVASNLQASPVTGTLITYSTAGVPWRAFGPAMVYQDSLFFIVRYRDTEARTSRIAWSEVDDPLTGYHQVDFDNEWDLIQNGVAPLYALWPTNLAVFYLREDSIGTFTGTVGVDLKTDATHDSIDAKIGTRSPSAVAAYADIIYFIDVEGRPQRIVNGALDPIWKQLERVVRIGATGWPDLTARNACGVIVPELDLYLVTIWSEDPTQAEPQFATTMYAFHAQSGRYVGEWTIGAGVAVHAMGTLQTIDGLTVLAVLGTLGAANVPQGVGDGGYLWTLRPLDTGIWQDDGDTPVPDIQVTSPPLGYDADLVLNVDRAVVVLEEAQTDSGPAVVELLVD